MEQNKSFHTAIGFKLSNSCAVLLLILGIIFICSACGAETDNVGSQSNSASNATTHQNKEKTEVSKPLPLTFEDVNRSDFSTIGISGGAVMAIDADGTLWGWGNNERGLISSDTSVKSFASPQKVMERVASIQVSPYFAVAIDFDGFLWGWGATYYDTEIIEPTKLLNVPAISAVIDGGINGATISIILSDGRVASFETQWSNNKAPWTVQGSIFGEASNLAFNSEWTHEYSLAVKSDGTLWGFGDNSVGQLGILDTEISTSAGPYRLMDGVAVADISAGASYAIKDDCSLWAWGKVGWGEPLSLPEDENRCTFEIPEKILDDVVGIYPSGCASGFIIKKDGTLCGWGYCDMGQLGNGKITGDYPKDNTYQSTLIKITDNVCSVATDGNTTFILKSNGDLYACGLCALDRFGIEISGNDTWTFWDVEYPIQSTPVKIMENVMIPSKAYEYRNFSDSIEDITSNESTQKSEDSVGVEQNNISAVVDISGEWQDSWSERCSMTITADGDDYYIVEAIWPSSSWEYDTWSFGGYYDSSTGQLSYDNGRWISFDESDTKGSADGAYIVLTDMSGTLTFENDTMYWDDVTSRVLDMDFGSTNMSFEKIQ